MRKRLQWSGSRHLVVGVTGGIATGKSTVSAMFSELGAILIDFDVLAREVVAPGEPALERIQEVFGSEFLQPDGALDRKRLSTHVFQDPRRRELLETITHPPIFERFFSEVEAITARRPDAIVQAAVPLLVELRLQPIFHRVVLVYAGYPQQLERLLQREGIDRRNAEKILAAQLPIDEKRREADFVIDNTQSLAETREQVSAVWRQLCGLQKSMAKW